MVSAKLDLRIGPLLLVGVLSRGHMGAGNGPDRLAPPRIVEFSLSTTGLAER
jgi:hypothetical protein